MAFSLVTVSTSARKLASDAIRSAAAIRISARYDKRAAGTTEAEDKEESTAVASSADWFSAKDRGIEDDGSGGGGGGECAGTGRRAGGR